MTSIISVELLDKILQQNGKYLIPENIKNGINQVLSKKNRTVILEEYRRLRDKYKEFRLIMSPAIIDYQGEVTLDAYLAYYLPRNIIIPWVTFRDLSLHKMFSCLPDKMTILDLGSGTGAVELGLLHLFSDKHFSGTEITIVSVDRHPEALEKQKMILSAAGYDLERVIFLPVNLESDTIPEAIFENAPYSFIFSANCVGELQPTTTLGLVSILSNIISDNGAIVFADPDRNFTKYMTRAIVQRSIQSNLHVYYPCPAPPLCNELYQYCWSWRYHAYLVPNITINGLPLDDEPKDQLITTGSILTKAAVSIYDCFKESQEELCWGPVAHKNPGYCNGRSIIKFDLNNKVCDKCSRGSIVGITALNEMQRYYEL